MHALAEDSQELSFSRPSERNLVRITKNVREGLRAEMTAHAGEIRAKYGPEIGWDQLLQLLDDRRFVHFPCEIRFDAEPLLPGEFAHALPKSSNLAEGFTIYVHPCYANQLPRVPYLVLEQLVLVNYGPSVTADDAETFGSCALGLTKEEYYRALCELSEQIGGDELL
jgi:hypothetical protein